MTTNAPQGSAQIFTFPPRGRFAVGGADTAAQSKTAANFASPQVVSAAFSGAWYHDEAVRDEEPPRKN